MNKEYAIQLLESVECGTLEADSSLAKEAFRYLLRLKSVLMNDNLYNRVYSAKHQTRRK